MWGLLPRPLQILLIVSLGVVGTLGFSAMMELLSEDKPPLHRCISFAASVLIPILVMAAEWSWRWIWKVIPALNGLVFPDLNGTWEGHLKSTWINPETGATPPPIPSKFWIRMGLFSMSVKMRTGESDSYSTRCFLEADRNAKIYRIWYSYENRPRAAVTHRSARHEGVAWLEIDGSGNLDALNGQYFTHRKTNGDISVTRTSTDIVRQSNAS